MSMTVSYTQAIADVKTRVTKSRTSFHSGMMVLPRERREAMYALYAFCREVDDIADDSPSHEIAAKGLQEWRERIASLFRSGQADNSITAALQPCIKRFGLVEEDFQAIIDGMSMDAGEPISAPDMQTLDLYCDRVASAVGRVSVRLFGDFSATAMKVAHHLGRAFQLTNILRDLKEDAARGRLYLPLELLDKYGIAARDTEHVFVHPRFQDVCRDLGLLALAHFKSADEFMAQCKYGAMRPARIMRGYYGAILDRLLEDNWRDLSVRIRLPRWKKYWLALRYGVM